VTSPLQHRASECARALIEDYAERLTVPQIVTCVATGLIHPDRITDERAGSLIALYCATVEART